MDIFVAIAALELVTQWVNCALSATDPTVDIGSGDDDGSDILAE